MDELFQSVLDNVDRFNGSPWGLLADMLEWNFAGPEVINSWDPFLEKLIRKNLKVHCVVCNTALCEFLIQKHADSVDVGHQLERGMFGNVTEAESWLAKQL